MREVAKPTLNVSMLCCVSFSYQNPRQKLVVVSVQFLVYIYQRDQRKNLLCEWPECMAYRQMLGYLLKNSEADNLAERAVLEISLS